MHADLGISTRLGSVVPVIRSVRCSMRSTSWVDTLALRHSPQMTRMRLSRWASSSAKRIFDCACIIPLIPFLIPLGLAVALAVRLTSCGPIFFLQKRTGRYGRTFTIVKFRTMVHSADIIHRLVTTEGNQLFTTIGPFLRRWKLDELPQLINVLKGDMSLVGPRPKVLEHRISVLPCRPGITGAATLAFACEETVLGRVSNHQLDSWYQNVVLPEKRRFDSEYMAHATLLSDLVIVAKSVLRHWNNSTLETLLDISQLEVDVSDTCFGRNVLPVITDSCTQFTCNPAFSAAARSRPEPRASLAAD